MNSSPLIYLHPSLSTEDRVVSSIEGVANSNTLYNDSLLPNSIEKFLAVPVCSYNGDNKTTPHTIQTIQYNICIVSPPPRRKSFCGCYVIKPEPCHHPPQIQISRYIELPRFLDTEVVTTCRDLTQCGCSGQPWLLQEEVWTVECCHLVLSSHQIQLCLLHRCQWGSRSWGCQSST